MIQIDGVVHWSIPVNDQAESEKFYSEILGLEFRGRLGDTRMSCFTVGGHQILLCERNEKMDRTPKQDNRLHHAFDLSHDNWVKAVRFITERGVRLAEPIVYRQHGFFTGAEMYILDPSGNLIELRDESWKPGMPTPSFEEIAANPAVATW